MPYKDPEKAKAYFREYHKKDYQKNKEKYKKRAKIGKEKSQQMLLEYKKTLSCHRCNLDFSEHPYICDFHHIDPSKKKDIVSRLFAMGCPKQGFEEIKKCIPLCANCHRILENTY